MQLVAHEMLPPSGYFKHSHTHSQTLTHSRRAELCRESSSRDHLLSVGASLAQDRGRLEARAEVLATELETQKKHSEQDGDSLRIKAKIIDDQTATIRQLKEVRGGANARHLLGLLLLLLLLLLLCSRSIYLCSILIFFSVFCHLVVCTVLTLRTLVWDLKLLIKLGSCVFLYFFIFSFCSTARMNYHFCFCYNVSLVCFHL